MDDATFLRNLARRSRVVLLADGTALPVPVSVMEDPARAGATFRINLISPEGAESGDRRTFVPGTIEHRDLPLPLLWQWQLADGHKNAVVVGRIDHIERTAKGLGNARGVFDTGPWGREAERMVRAGMVRGVSGDYSSFSAKILEKVDPEDQRITDDKISVDRSKLVAATIVAKPAFEDCYIEILEDDEFLPNGVIEGTSVVVTAAALKLVRPDMVARLERLEQLEAEQLSLIASATAERVNRYRLEREREDAVARVRAARNVTAAFKPMPKSWLSAKAKAQPRDMKGRWIEIGSMARWRHGSDRIGGVQRGNSKGVGHAGGGAPFKQGRVKSFDAKTGEYEIEPVDGGAPVKLKGADIEIVKAVIPESPTEAQKINSDLDAVTQKLIGDTDTKMSAREIALRKQLGDDYVDHPGNRGYIQALLGDEKMSPPKGDPDATINIDEALGNTPAPDAPSVTPEEAIEAGDQQKKDLTEAIQAAKSDDPDIKGIGLDRLSDLMGAEIESGDTPFQTNREQRKQSKVETKDIARAAENDRIKNAQDWPDRETLGRQLFNNLHTKGETWEEDQAKYLRAGDRLRRLSETRLISKKRRAWIKNTYGQDAAPIDDRHDKDLAWSKAFAGERDALNTPDAPDAPEPEVTTPETDEAVDIGPLVTKLNDLWGTPEDTDEPESPTAAVDLWAEAKEDAVSKIGGDIVKSQQEKNAKGDDPFAAHDKALAEGNQWAEKPNWTGKAPSKHHPELNQPSQGEIDAELYDKKHGSAPKKKTTVPQFGSNKSTKTVFAPEESASPKVSKEPAGTSPAVSHPSDASEAELESAKKYSVNAYGPINKKLRTGESSDNPKYPDDVIAEHVKNLDSLIARSKSTKNSTLWRGIASSALGDIEPGSVFTDKGFSSTTTDEYVAKSGISKTFEGDATLLELRAPKGTNMMDADAGGSQMGESEFVLPRGSRFKVAEIVTDEDGTRRVIADVLPAEDAAPAGNWTVMAKTMYENLHPDSSWGQADQAVWIDAAKKAMETKHDAA